MMYIIGMYTDDFNNEYTAFGETISECISKLENEAGVAVIFNNINFFEAKQIKVKQEFIIE